MLQIGHEILVTKVQVDGKELAQIKHEIGKLAKGAKNPFQFIACLMHLCGWSLSELTYSSLPISMDASSSAYKIMSYLLLDLALASRTHLVIHGGII